ncbi:MAG: flap endonuclease-1 [Candidatus Woesearchaeota archaeon]
MGVSISELLARKEIKIEELSNRKIIVDAPMWLYQFLSSIRQSNGAHLTDERGNPTSHLVGLSSRIPNLLEKNIKLAFVFDGKPPELKSKEIIKRRTAKIDAEKKYNEAFEAGDEKEMRKYAMQATRVSTAMIDETKEFLKALGIPVIQAESEAEAQGAYMIKKGDAYALATNDADALMFEAPLIIRNLSLVGKRRQAGRSEYKIVSPEEIYLKENLKQLGIDNSQLIALCMLVGTDFNPGGIKGIGPKKALKLVREKGSDNDSFSSLFKEAGWQDYFDFSWTDVFDVIKKMPVSDEYELKWSEPNPEKIKEILVEKHNFSAERVNSMLERINNINNKKQKSLGDFW